MDEPVEAIPIVIRVTYLDVSDFVQDDFSIQARMHTNRSSLITWDRVEDEDYYLEKSEDTISGWTVIAKLAPNDAFQVLDEYANNTFHRHGYEFYRLVFPTSKKVSRVASVYGFADLYGSEIARRHQIMLNRGLNGNLCYTLVRMRQGIRCPDCWDSILQQRTRTGCRTCKDTAYLVGYHNPIPLYISFGTESDAMDVGIDGPKNPMTNIDAWTANFPILSTGDIIFEGKSRALWVVLRAEVTSHKRVVTKQHLVLEKSVGDDIIWELLHRLPEGAV